MDSPQGFDGNVEFLKGKHILLFVATLFLLLLFLPYTFLLLCIQWIQRISHYHILFWINRFLPLFDAYTGPYKLKHRYWIGLLLLVRVLILLTFSLNYSNNPAHNLLGVALISFTLVGYLSTIGGVYKNLVLNILEVTFFLNIGMLSIAALYLLVLEEKSNIPAYISTGIAATIFIHSCCTKGRTH